MPFRDILENQQPPKFLKYFKNWTIKNQVLLLQVLLICSISSILIGFLFLLNYLVDTSLASASQKIFAKQLNEKSTLIHEYFMNMHHITMVQMKEEFKKINKIYLILEEQFETGELKWEANKDDYFSPHLRNDSLMQLEDYSVCYFVANSSDLTTIDANHSYLYPVLSEMAKSVPFFQSQIETTFSQLLYYTFTAGDTQVFNMMPCIDFPKSLMKEYIPSNRLWQKQSNLNIRYKNQVEYYLLNQASLEQLEIPIVSEPYQDFITGTVLFTFTKTLINYESKIGGIIARDMNFNSYISHLINSENFTLYMITTKNGLLLQTNFLEGQNISDLYLFNQTETGFSENDWLQITYFALNQTYQDSCDKDVDIAQLCRFNQKINQSMLIQSSYEPVYNFFIITYNIEFIIISLQLSVDEELTQELAAINEQIYHLSNQLIQNTLYASFSLAFIAFLLLHLVFYPLKQLTIYTNQIIYKNTYQDKKNKLLEQQINLENLTKSGTIGKLIKSFLKMSGRLIFKRKKKSELCLQIERIQYPKKDANCKLNVEKYISLLRNRTTKQVYRTSPRLPKIAKETFIKL